MIDIPLNKFMLILGFIGQTVFFSRFVIQWIVSEIKKESVIPMIFWYLSITGSIILLVYSIYRKDPVFIVGQSVGFVVYIRNIFLVRGKTRSMKTKSD